MQSVRWMMGVVGIGLCLAATRGFAQGSLTPPGAPEPTMKSLAQIEPRTPITNAPTTITQPGSYYLTTNLTVTGGDAITISASGVTLDLNGFTIASTAPSATGTAILLASGLRNLTILNGFIQGGVTNNGNGVYSGSGFNHGINYGGVQPANARASGLSIAGCLWVGIDLGPGQSVAESCTVRTVGLDGIHAGIIKSSSATDCGGGGALAGGDISDCYGDSNGGGATIYATTANNCHANNSGTGNGLSATTAINCYAYNSGTGIGLSASTAQNCLGSSFSTNGLLADIAINCIGSSGSGVGLLATTAQNCYGSSTSTNGLLADIAMNCKGQSSTSVGLRFTKMGAMCWGERTTPAATNYVLGGGMVGPVNLP